MPSSPDGVTLNFTFPNIEIKKLEIHFPYTTKVSEVIKTLIDNWPTANGAPKLEPNCSIKLICMGLGYLDDSKTLQNAEVPYFTTSSTPVVVIIRDKKQASSNDSGACILM